MIVLRPQTTKRQKGADGRMMLTPANQLLVMGQTICSMNNPEFEPEATF
jgi:hypothetical protein